jgi:response regulator RpfG family c-di-GMP phosphodiesterase
LTGVADSEIQQEANSSGINLFLIKPVRLADLEVVLKGVITGQDNAKVDTQKKRDNEEQKKRYEEEQKQKDKESAEIKITAVEVKVNSLLAGV